MIETDGRHFDPAQLTASEQTATRTKRWSLDDDGSSVDFAVKTFWGLVTVRGRFGRFDGSYEVGPDGTKSVRSFSSTTV